MRSPKRRKRHHEKGVENLPRDLITRIWSYLDPLSLFSSSICCRSLSCTLEATSSLYDFGEVNLADFSSETHGEDPEPSFNSRDNISTLSGLLHFLVRHKISSLKYFRTGTIETTLVNRCIVELLPGCSSELQVLDLRYSMMKIEDVELLCLRILRKQTTREPSGSAPIKVDEDASNRIPQLPPMPIKRIRLFGRIGTNPGRLNLPSVCRIRDVLHRIRQTGRSFDSITGDHQDVLDMGKCATCENTRHGLFCRLLRIQPDPRKNYAHL